MTAVWYELFRVAVIFAAAILIALVALVSPLAALL